MNLGNLGKLLDRYDISLDDTKVVRVVPGRRGDMTSPLFLEVKRYLKDDEGKRFMVRWPPHNRPSVAYERIRIPLSALDVAGEADLYDPTVRVYEQDRHFSHVHASEVIEEQRPKREASV